VVAIARVPDVSFGVRNDPEWSMQQMGEGSRIRPQAASSSEAVAGPVGAMGTRLWEDRAAANHCVDRFVLASTCIHLIREGWKEPRSIVEEASDFFS
jgi:hypothetical protein